MEDDDTVVSVETEESAGPPDWPDWQPAMVTGRELEDTDQDLPIVMHEPQIWTQRVGTGPEYDRDKHWRVVRAVKQRLPDEDFSREYETFLCFERLIVHDRELRGHRNRYRCWEIEGRPLMIRGVNKRFLLDDLT